MNYFRPHVSVWIWPMSAWKFKFDLFGIFTDADEWPDGLEVCIGPIHFGVMCDAFSDKIYDWKQKRQSCGSDKSQSCQNK